VSLSVREMCLLSAAVGWMACGVCFWIFPRWRAPDVHRMSYAELKTLLLEIRREYIERNPAKPKPDDFDLPSLDEARILYDAEREENGKSSKR
jgi:hypothetical protein